MASPVCPVANFMHSPVIPGGHSRPFGIRISGLGFDSPFVICHSSFAVVILSPMDTLLFATSSLAGLAVGGIAVYFLMNRKAQAARDQLAAAQTSLALAQQQSATFSADLAGARQQAAQYQSAADALRNDLAAAQANAAALSAQLASSEKNISEQKKLLDDANRQLTAAFATVSQNALD